MHLEPECIPCLINQVLRAFQLLKPDTPREIVIDTQKKLMEYLINFDLDKRASPIIGKVAYNLVAEALGVNDPYASIKKKYNKLALQFYDEARKIVNNAEDPLLEAIVVAALGNTIDFGTSHKIDFIHDIKNFTPDKLAINDYETFKQSLLDTDHLLILLDNAGEIVFDKLLVETMLKTFPELEITCSVRSAPIINDATLEDAKFVGLTELVQVIEASGTPGIDLPNTSDEFKKHFFLKDGVILSKGQGNFESLHGMEIPNKELYYLLKVKCSLMVRLFSVKEGNIIFKRKTENF
ncbi:MAG: damage-control phosphatase ARMT1 family protein [Promethearchaeota archaeon]